MPRGKKAKPTAILKLENSSQLRKPRHKRPEPSPPDGASEMPKWLDAEGRAMWDRLHKHLAAMGLLKITDGETIAAACQCWSLFVRTSKQVSKIKDIDRDARLVIVTNREARDAWYKWASEFGLTPVARTRIDAGVEQRIEDEFEAFLNMGKKSG